MNAKIEIYTGPLCNYCDLAIDLLNSMNIEFIEIKLSEYPNKKKEMLIRTGGRKTVPQIFINNNLIGGFNELKSLELSGKLKEMLNIQLLFWKIYLKYLTIQIN